MPRIRTIKPELPQSESIGRLSREARLLFIMLFTAVDDAGRCRGAPRMLASLLYPYDDDVPRLIEAWLAELINEGLVRRYERHGSTYLDIPKWLDHQKIDRPSPSRLPSFDDASTNVRELSRSLDADPGPEPGPGPGPGPGIKVAAASAASEKRSKTSDRGTRLDPNWQPLERNIADAKAIGLTDSDIRQEVAKMKDWAASAIGSKAVKRDWDAAWRNWCRSAAERLGRAPQQTQSGAHAGATTACFVTADSEQWKAWQTHYRVVGGPGGARHMPPAVLVPSRGVRGNQFPTEWPPGHTPTAIPQAPTCSQPAQGN
jgi:hypothetical protein